MFFYEPEPTMILYLHFLTNLNFNYLSLLFTPFLIEINTIYTSTYKNLKFKN